MVWFPWNEQWGGEIGRRDAIGDYLRLQILVNLDDRQRGCCSTVIPGDAN